MVALNPQLVQCLIDIGKTASMRRQHLGNEGLLDPANARSPNFHRQAPVRYRSFILVAVAMPADGFVGRHAQAADELIGLGNENRLDDLADFLPEQARPQRAKKNLHATAGLAIGVTLGYIFFKAYLSRFGCIGPRSYAGLISLSPPEIGPTSAIFGRHRLCSVFGLLPRMTLCMEMVFWNRWRWTMSPLEGIIALEDVMLEQKLVDRALQLQRVPIIRDDRVIAHQVAASLRLEGIEATGDDVLDAAQALEP